MNAEGADPRQTPEGLRDWSWRAGLVFVVLLLPWVNPFAGGPSPAVQPWLFSLGCGALFAALSPSGAPPPAGLVAAALAGLAWALIAAGALTPEWLGLAAACALVLLVAWAARGLPASLQRVTVWAWLVAALVSAVIGMCQYLGWATWFAPWMNVTGPGEAYANLRQRNQFATLTSIGLASLCWWCRSPGGTPAGRGGAWMAPAAALLLAAGNAASASRTGLLQLAMLGMAALAWGWWWQPPLRRLLLAAGTGYLAAALVLPGLIGLDPSSHGIFARVADGVPPCSSRMTLWSNVAHLIALKPWAGWGWGELDYAHYATLYGAPRFCDILDHAHNLPLHLAVELGLPAAVALSVALLAWLATARPWRERAATQQLAWLALGFVLLHSMLEYPLWYGPFQLVLGVCAGWLAPRPASSGTPPRALPPVGARPWRASLALGLLVAAMYTAWEYQRVSQIYAAPAQRSAWWRDITVAQLGDNWLFRSQVRFAALTTAPLTRDNAAETAALALRMLHYSPEPRVIELLVESLVLLGRDDEALWHLARYRAAFPADYEAWRGAASRPPAPR